MKIKEAWQAYTTQIDALREQRKTLSKTLNDSETSDTELGDYDRVELTRQLSSIDAQIEATSNGRDEIIEAWATTANAESAKQQNNEIFKIMEVYRRIASGAKVPHSDEQKLMDYNSKLYAAAKQAALMAKKNDQEYDSLWDEEEDDEKKDPIKTADETDISVASPENVAAAAAARVETFGI